MKKICSVLELSRYKIGEVAWWIRLSDTEIPILNDESEWMEEYHPLIMYNRGIMKWRGPTKPPRIHDLSFLTLTSILQSELMVEEFLVSNIKRSNNTGGFQYENEENDWAPECCLYDTKIAANKEHRRILKLVEKWKNEQSKH